MSRLLHAAARGARIEAGYKDTWVPAIAVYLADVFTDYRIHPDDAHLQYGPISTALRDVALTDDFHGADIPYLQVTLLGGNGYSDSTEEQRCVFLLILAEALADEGM